MKLIPTMEALIYWYNCKSKETQHGAYKQATSLKSQDGATVSSWRPLSPARQVQSSQGLIKSLTAALFEECQWVIECFLFVLMGEKSNVGNQIPIAMGLLKFLMLQKWRGSLYILSVSGLDNVFCFNRREIKSGQLNTYCKWTYEIPYYAANAKPPIHVLDNQINE